MEILACPVDDCHGPLKQGDNSLVCRGCGRRYRIEQRWPVLITDEAETPAAHTQDPTTSETR